MLKKRHVTVIINSQLLRTNISDHQITQTVRECVNLSDPGPPAFILVLQHNDFTEDDLRRVKHVLKEFSEDAIKYTIVLTTDEETHRAEVKEFFQQLTAECGGGHLQAKDKKIRSQIFKRVKNTLKGKYFHGKMKETPMFGSSEDAEDSISVDSDLSEDENIDESHKEKKEERRTFSFSKIPNPLSRRDQSPEGKRPNMSTLNLVVCGSNETLKSSISELIQQQIDRRSDVELHDRLINLLKLPALIGLSEEEVMRQTLFCQIQHRIAGANPPLWRKILQGPKVSIETMKREISAVIDFLQDFREHRFNAAKIDAREIAEKIEVKMIWPDVRQKKTKRQFDYEGTEETTSNAEEHFRREFFLHLVDTALVKTRRDSHTWRTF
ncbi:hypothetical protein G5714_004063 [Onychostoma macrolepis]|uniref:AIG1-type G domain-containing protein n=1 Tax=Onychostoma macrolepis TaxID=369639 RepID=A0A7J6DCH4_9TELE|nr:hypothetical protein G5714_004063 [Onychostoma macrolepis]